MNVPIPDIRVGEPSVFGGVAVFPLFAERSLFPHGTPDYLLSEEAMAAGTMVVQEVSEEGSVGELLAENVGDQSVLMLEGEEMKGAKQNRVLASSVLIAGKSRTRIPVCCVQWGRWTYSSRQSSPGSCCPPSLRHVLKEGHRPDQFQMWTTIRRQHRRLGVRSQTENMSDALETHGEKVAELRRILQYPQDASGIAVVLGGKVVSVDLFDKPPTLERLWDRLLQGIALDAMELRDSKCRASGSDVSVQLYLVRNVRWQKVEPVVGLGEAYRGRGDDDTLATALVTGGTLIHLGMSMPV
jgi:hypothetical protein